MKVSLISERYRWGWATDSPPPKAVAVFQETNVPTVVLKPVEVVDAQHISVSIGF